VRSIELHSSMISVFPHLHLNVLLPSALAAQPGVNSRSTQGISLCHQQEQRSLCALAAQPPPPVLAPPAPPPLLSQPQRLASAK